MSIRASWRSMTFTKTWKWIWGVPRGREFVANVPVVTKEFDARAFYEGTWLDSDLTQATSLASDSPRSRVEEALAASLASVARAHSTRRLISTTWSDVWRFWGPFHGFELDPGAIYSFL